MTRYDAVNFIAHGVAKNPIHLILALLAQVSVCKPQALEHPQQNVVIIWTQRLPMLVKIFAKSYYHLVEKIKTLDEP